MTRTALAGQSIGSMLAGAYVWAGWPIEIGVAVSLGLAVLVLAQRGKGSS